MGKLKDLKKGSFFVLNRLDEPKESQVYIKGEYDRGSKSYSCVRFEDTNNERFLKADREVYGEFTF